MPAKRSLVVLAILGSLAPVSCDLPREEGDSRHERAAAGCPGSVGSGPTVELRYRVESDPTAPGSFAQTMSALCRRFERLGFRTVAVGQAGHELVVRAPPRLEAEARALAMPGALHFYDWDANAVGRSGSEAPFSTLFGAVQAASRMGTRVEATDVAPGATQAREEADRTNNAFPAARYYLFGADRRLLAGPAAGTGALATVRGRDAPGVTLLKLPPGVAVVGAERAARQPEEVRRYFVLEDDSELAGTDIANPRVERARATGEPIVAFGFTPRGRVAFAALTKRIAERAARAVPSGGPGVERLAIVLDDRVVALAAVDPRENPGGLDGSAGAQISGLGTRAQARRVALLLTGGPLPGRLVPLPGPR